MVKVCPRCHSDNYKARTSNAGQSSYECKQCGLVTLILIDMDNPVVLDRKEVDRRIKADKENPVRRRHGKKFNIFVILFILLFIAISFWSFFRN